MAYSVFPAPRPVRTAAAFGLALLCGALTAGCTAPAAPPPRVAIADPDDAKALAAWQARMVRPCAKSGNRMIC